MVRIGHTVLGEKGTKICVPIVGTTMKEILDATAVASKSSFMVVPTIGTHIFVPLSPSTV